MFNRSLATFAVLGALVGVSVPVHAQDHMWSTARPDALQVSGIVGDIILPAGALDIQYTFGQENFEGVQFGTDPVSFATVLDIYDSSPFERRNRTHRLNVAYGITDDLTIRASGGVVEYDRDVLDQEFFLFRSENDGVTDVEAELMLSAYDTDNIRTHVGLGVQIPVGAIDMVGNNAVDGTALLPYSLQHGTGSFALIPGVTGQIQNEYGTVGAQVKARIRLNNNDRNYRVGDDVVANAWASLHLNDVIAVHSGVRATRTGGIQGFDPELDPARDPAEDVLLSSATRVDLPLGINFRLDRGILAGNTLGFEFLFPVHQDYDNFRLTAERGFNVTWRHTFGM